MKLYWWQKVLAVWGGADRQGGTIPSLRCPKCAGSLFASPHFDRYAFASSLYPPQAALGCKARTKRAQRYAPAWENGFAILVGAAT
ncbi:MAG: hypothetical protein IJB36_04750 [Clostridia bacterium]|nr:hypothetical protein [Clostridia bacterium]